MDMDPAPSRQGRLRRLTTAFLLVCAGTALSAPAFGEQQLDEPEAVSEESSAAASEVTTAQADDGVASEATPTPAATAVVSEATSTPAEAPTRRNLAWLGWTVTGVGLVFLGLGIWSTASVADAQETVDSERSYWPDGVDVCVEAANGNVGPGSSNDSNDIAAACDRGYAFTVLQPLFYSVGTVAFGLGLFLAIREHLRQRRADRETARLAVDVALTDRGAFVLTSLPF